MPKYRIKVEELCDGTISYIPQRKGWFSWKNYYCNNGERFSCSRRDAAERFIKSFKIKSIDYINV